MSHSSTHAMSTRLFIQAAVTGLLAPTSARGSTWLVLTLAVAAGALGVGTMLRNGTAEAKRLIIGFEGIAVAVGGLGLASGHYIPGTIIGVATLITALNSPVAAPAAAGSPWTPPADPAAVGVAPWAPPQTPGVQYAAPAMSAPVMDNPYAPPQESTVPMWAPPTPVAAVPEPVLPPAAAVPEPVLPPVAAVPEQVPPPAAEVPTVPPAPEDIPPMPRSMTILPGS